MSIWGDAGDANVVDVGKAHVQVLGDVVVGAARNETEFVILIVDCHGVGVELVVLFPDEIQLGADVKFVEGFATIPIGKAGDVEVVKMDFLNGFVFSVSHGVLCLILVSDTKVDRGCLKMWYRIEKSYRIRIYGQ